MNMIENVEKPLAKCPACEGKGIIQRLSFDASVNVTNVDEEEFCLTCGTSGEVSLSVLDDWNEFYA